MNFGERLRQLRKENGYTQATLAEILDLSKGTIAMWETGNRMPDYEMMKKLSDMFDRSMEYLLGYSDDETSPRIAEERNRQHIQWEEQNEQIDIFRQYLRLDVYGQMSVNALIRREAVRCQDQGTEQDISNIRVGIQNKKRDAMGEDTELPSK